MGLYFGILVFSEALSAIRVRGKLRLCAIFLQHVYAGCRQLVVRTIMELFIDGACGCQRRCGFVCNQQVACIHARYRHISRRVPCVPIYGIVLVQQGQGLLHVSVRHFSCNVTVVAFAVYGSSPFVDCKLGDPHTLLVSGIEALCTLYEPGYIAGVIVESHVRYQRRVATRRDRFSAVAKELIKPWRDAVIVKAFETSA